MIPLEKMTDEQFARHVLELLSEGLGPDGMARFLSSYRSGPGDYTRDRQKWLDGLTIDEILKESRGQGRGPRRG